jgi:zinc and cadmium transporter
MQIVALLFVYSLICVGASLAGGWIPLVVELTHKRMQIAISFVSGIVLGIGLLHLLPHSFAALGSIDVTMLWVLAGFLFMFFLERFFHFHHHEAPGEESPLLEDVVCDREHEHAHAHRHHGHSHGHSHGHNQGHSRLAFSWVGVIIGLTLHGLVDGVTLAAAVKSEEGHGVLLAGIGACLAIALHKPFDSLTIGTMMAAAGKSTRARQLLNAAYALVTPLGIILFYALAGAAGSTGLGQTLGFAAGAFLCIATGDLLPELQFHRHDRFALSASLVAGIALAWGTVFLESSGHDHYHGPPPAQKSHEQHEGHGH